MWQSTAIISLILYAGSVSSQEQTCGNIHQLPYYGWTTPCDSSLSVNACLAVGPHCAYCFDNGKEKCGYRTSLENTCKKLHFNNPERQCEQATTPDECVAAHNSCSWCADPHFTDAVYPPCLMD